MSANIFEPYRTFLSNDPYLEFEFETLDDLSQIEPFPTHMTRDGFENFAVHGNTIFAVYNDKLWIVGWVKNTVDILKPPYPAKIGRVWPLGYKSSKK